MPEFKYYIDRKKVIWERYELDITAMGDEDADALAKEIYKGDLNEVVYIDDLFPIYPEATAGRASRELYKVINDNNFPQIISNNALPLQEEKVNGVSFPSGYKYAAYEGSLGTEKSDKIKVTLKNGRIECNDSRIEIEDLDNEEPTDDKIVEKPDTLESITSKNDVYDWYIKNVLK